MTNDITMTFDRIIKQCHTLELSEETFRVMLDEDEQLVANYTEWCETMGVTERKGFAYYYEEYFEHQDTIWDSLADHDEFN